MASSEIKIFYSWQSDLPGNATRNLIQDSIDAVVKAMKNTVEIVADRDTKGEFGSPDIVQTIFSKIDESDIFIADVSVINKYHSLDEEGNPTHDIKTSPNPNVLLELGYAAHSLGWENIICIINTDFGSIEDLPFDIAHRRLTPFSLKDKSKSDVRKELREIIAATVMNLLENGKRPKGLLASHIVGGYDLESKNIVQYLVPVNMDDVQWYKDERSSMLDKCRSLIETISRIKLESPKEEIAPLESKEEPQNTVIVKPDGTNLTPIKTEWLQKLTNASYLVKVKKDEMEYVARQVKSWFGIDLQDDFFCLGNLHRETAILAGQSSELIGSVDEKTKYNNFQELEYNLHRISLLDMYIETFKGMYLFPLAIQNTSSISDKDISIVISIDSKMADVILPNAKLINQELVGVEGLIYDEGIIKNLLIMPETKDIQYDEDISYDINDSLSQMRRTPIIGIGNSYPEYDSSDYEREIRKYIATPIDGSVNEFDFNIKGLRPKEKSWLGAAILLRPKTDTVSLSYSIISQMSDGSLSGRLECEIPK